MNVGDMMTYRPLVVEAASSVAAAARLMRSHVVGALPVIDDGELVGIVTDRDLAMRLRADAPPAATRVRDLMTPAPVAARADEPLDRAVARMLERRVRRLVVVDESDRVCGVLSVDDLVLLPETQALAVRLLQQVALARGELDGTLDEAPR